jgi:hypothetical protein
MMLKKRKRFTNRKGGNIMKKIVFCISLVLLVSSLSFAQGIEGIPIDGIHIFCTQQPAKYWLSLEKTTCPYVYALHGFNYYELQELPGEIVHGALYISGEYAYIGLNGSHRMYGDFGAISSLNFIIDLKDMAGDYIYHYGYMMNNTCACHGGRDTCNVRLGPCP